MPREIKIANTISKLAREIAIKTPDFNHPKGAGVGDIATLIFMRTLRQHVEKTLGNRYAEKKICGNNNLTVDFYIPEEKTIIEVALGLKNPTSEFEKDVLKALIAKENGCEVTQLIFLAKKGAIKKRSEPSSKAIISWAESNHEIKIQIKELD